MKARQQSLLARTALLAGTAAVATYAAAAPRPADSRPNILLIITDQQRADMLSCAGNRYVRTSALDRLAARGIRFERAYCANPVCVPSRFSMMTGVMPSRIALESNDQFTNAVPPSLLAHSLGTIFRNAGYDTFYGGKLHLPGGDARGLSGTYGFSRLTPDEREDLAQSCATFLRQPHARPFLLVASFINPHDICYLAINAHAETLGLGAPHGPALQAALLIPPGVTRAKFFKQLCPPLPPNFGIPDGEPPATRQTDWLPSRAYVDAHWTVEDWRLHRWAYARLTERVDSEIGTVLNALHEGGHDGDTLVVFTSDHGEMDGSHHLEQKSVPYNEAIHVPLIISGPGVSGASRVDRSHLVSAGLDLIPTLCDFAGIPIPPALKGRSLKPLTAGAAVPGWRANLVVENEHSRILLSEAWKYAVYDFGQPREFLLDVQRDPGEMHNLAPEKRSHSILEQQRSQLRLWYEANAESLPGRYTVPITALPSGRPAALRQRTPQL